MTPLLQVSGLHKHFPLSATGTLGRFLPLGRFRRARKRPSGCCALSMVSLLPSRQANALAWSVNPAVANPRWYG